VSFRHEKYDAFGGPDGGDGGRGGNIIFSASTDYTSLHHIPSHLVAKNGEYGKGKQRYGKHGADLIVKIPIGTTIKELLIQTISKTYEIDADVKVFHDMDSPEDRSIIARGGKGGLGNIHFATPINRTPKRATEGEKGESKVLLLELKTIADIGLIGLPNAGKSTFLAAVSNAHPKIAPYPFTTLNPYVGTIDYSDYYQITVADIPGLVVGASQNVGLGHQFLRHIERAKMLLYILDMACEEIIDMNPKNTQKENSLLSNKVSRNPWNDFQSLQRELEIYKTGMTQRPSLIVANKMDVGYRAENHLSELRQNTNIPIIPISAKFMMSIEKVTSHVRNTIESLKS
jgi:GTP-binding protein